VTEENLKQRTLWDCCVEHRTWEEALDCAISQCLEAGFTLASINLVDPDRKLPLQDFERNYRLMLGHLVVLGSLLGYKSAWGIYESTRKLLRQVPVLG
jgi:hypothetical protein